MDDLQQLEVLSLVSKLTAELAEFTGVTDKTLAQFVLDIHEKCRNAEEFKSQLAELGANFPESFIHKMDTLIREMHPKYRNSVKKAGNSAPSSAKPAPRETFSGLALPDGKPAWSDSPPRSPRSPRLPRSPPRFRSRSRSPKSRTTDEFGRTRRLDRLDRPERSRYPPRSPSRSPPRSGRFRSDAEEQDTEPVIGKVYRGRVRNLTSFGAFVALLGVRGTPDGLAHISALSESRVAHPSDVLSRSQLVYVKVLRIDGSRISLSVKDVDQRTGEPLPEPLGTPGGRRGSVAQPGARSVASVASGSNAVALNSSDVAPRGRKRLTSPERWELEQLRAAGVPLAGSGLEEADEDSDEDKPSRFEPEEAVEIEVREEEPPFLAGQTKRSLQLSPVRVVKAPDGSLNRAAMNGSALARERREERMKGEASGGAGGAGGNSASNNGNTVSATSTGVSIPVSNVAQPAKPLIKTPSKATEPPTPNKSAPLPVSLFRPQFLAAVAENQILIVVGDTGSGKTTQLTQYLAEAGYATHGIVACTQPRRVAAVSVARRVAQEVGCKLGTTVGYTIRFDDCTSPETRIKYMTDGMLQREAIADPDLSRYSVILLDEAHERTVATDILFALVKAATVRRPDLRLIVTSATLDAEKFSQYFRGCPVLNIPGRSYPVDVLYSKTPEPDYLDAALVTALQIHLSEPAGDVLVFLTGQEEIDTFCEALTSRVAALGPGVPPLEVLPVYAALPPEAQSRIFDPPPPGGRKVVVATNIAETSITIDGIMYVVDPGFVKVNAYDPKLGMDSLVVAPISQAQARQRAGRAGRTGPGKCFRLYTQEAYENEMLPNPIPEIQRQNLAHSILMLKAMGINDLLHFDFMDPPPAATMLTALEDLYALGALDEEGLLTRLGRKMADFPMRPELAKVLLASVDLGCSEEVLAVVAMLSVQTVFTRPRQKQQEADRQKARFHDASGDHLTLLNVFRAWERNGGSRSWCAEHYVQDRGLRRAAEVRKQLATILARHGATVVSCGSKTEPVRRAFCAGFFRNAARRDPQEGYRTVVENTPVFLHPSSALFGKSAEYVIYHTLLLTSKEYMHGVTAVDPKWLVEAAPTFFRVADAVRGSKRQQAEKITPLFDRYAASQDAWRLSARKKQAKGSSATFG